MPAEKFSSLLSITNNAIVGVNRAHSGPQLTPVWYVWDGREFLFSTAKDRAKYRNLRRDASLTLIVEDPVAHEYVAAYGRAEIIDRGVPERARRLVEKYMPRRVEEGMKMMRVPNRVVVLLKPEKFLTS